MKLLGEGGGTPKAQHLVATFLATAAAEDTSSKGKILAAGALEPLQRLAGSGPPDVKFSATNAVSALESGS